MARAEQVAQQVRIDQRILEDVTIHLGIVTWIHHYCTVLSHDNEYQTLDPTSTMNHSLPERDAYYRTTTQHLNNEMMHPVVMSPEEGEYHRMLVTSAGDMETRFQPITVFASQGQLNVDQTSPKSLDLEKHFHSESDEGLNPVQPCPTSKSIKARTLNFPKATFV
ncbi:unnamed protein product [Dibothriocephalus latus]|uniref:Uncharacterized protein n=1 Tax=Dibothriocephalus latus TaxID=60516 RepID=A0A3P7MTD2_DIBLA|nr:unnamed protein product [Dibothriocephalus latus]